MSLLEKSYLRARSAANHLLITLSYLGSKYIKSARSLIESACEKTHDCGLLKLSC